MASIRVFGNLNILSAFNLDHLSKSRISLIIMNSCYLKLNTIWFQNYIYLALIDIIPLVQVFPNEKSIILRIWAKGWNMLQSKNKYIFFKNQYEWEIPLFLKKVFQNNLINKSPMHWCTYTKWMPINVDIKREWQSKLQFAWKPYKLIY